ncbi:MAG: methyltransferase domain-containing protein [Chloroflexota bacterium]
MHLFVPARKNNPELLDEGAGSLEDVRQSLNDLTRINHYLGGIRAITVHLFRRLKQFHHTAHILDIGTGNASLSATIEQWGERHQHSLEITGLDLMSRHLSIASQELVADSSIQLLQADGLHLPFADESVDFIVCSLLLHHLTHDEVVHFLCEVFRCARYSIIINDLVRGYLPYFGYKLIQPVFNLHPITRQDGETSIMRGFTPNELQAMAQEADLHNAIIHQHPMFRMTLVVDK